MSQSGQDSREAIRHVHPLEQRPKVPEPEVEGIAHEELAVHSPDGRPASRPAWSRGRMALIAILGLGLPLVVLGVWLSGGQDALLMGMGYVLLFILISYPVWYSGLIRERERREANEIIQETLSAERFGPTRHAQ
jgi:hypothetical protein